MTTDDNIRDKNYNMILKETKQKYWHYQVKLIDMEILQMEKYYLMIKVV